MMLLLCSVRHAVEPISSPPLQTMHASVRAEWALLPFSLLIIPSSTVLLVRPILSLIQIRLNATLVKEDHAPVHPDRLRLKIPSQDLTSALPAALTSHLQDLSAHALPLAY